MIRTGIWKRAANNQHRQPGKRQAKAIRTRAVATYRAPGRRSVRAHVYTLCPSTDTLLPVCCGEGFQNLTAVRTRYLARVPETNAYEVDFSKEKAAAYGIHRCTIKYAAQSHQPHSGGVRGRYNSIISSRREGHLWRGIGDGLLSSPVAYLLITTSTVTVVHRK